MEQKKMELLENAGIKCEEAIYRFSGNEEMFESFLKKFLTDPSYGKLEAAIKAGDYKEAFSAGHTLKGVTANLGINSVYEVLNPLVEALRHEDKVPYDEMFAKVTQAHEKICDVIRAL